MASTPELTTTLLRAWRGEIALAELIDLANSLEAAGQPELTSVLYRTWLDHTDSPVKHLVEFNLGALYHKLTADQPAEAAYQRAIATDAGFVHPRLNLGMLYERQGRLTEAIDAWRAIAAMPVPASPELRPTYVTALNSLGRVLELTKEYEEALGILQRSLELDPEQADVLHHWVFLRQRVCAWPIYIDVPGVLRARMVECTSALAMISLSDDPAEQLRAAHHYVEQNLLRNLQPLAAGTGYGHTRLRIAYLSSDFCLHPVAMLTVELLECHDRTHFEVFGFDWTRDDGSALRARVRAACDHFVPIHDLDDAAAARLIRDHEIDILVDLQGQTAGARANILEYRPAPIQITYLGLPATTGLPAIDHVIADRFLIPPEEAPHYSEQPLYLPDVYMASDRQRRAATAPTRADCGLPASGFVFCSFNNSFKYTPEVFALWMQILKAVPDSVLWLLADNRWAETALRRAANAHGVSEQRLVFAPRAAPERYLARYQVADLFLDTYPFNAGTTANDCLWMGCPLLTRSGRTFAARMAGALLTAAGLPELITWSAETYRDTAIALAQDPARCQGLRARLAEVRERGALFDTPRFTRHLETRLIELVQALPASG